MKKFDIRQFARFVLIGGMNTLVDFILLNILIWQFGISRNDPRFVYFKVISFAIASVNSFIFNKRWVFKSKEGQSSRGSKVLLLFTLTSAVALVLNTSVAYAVFNASHQILPTTDSQTIANLSALAGTIVVLLFNFFMYRSFVFKQPKESSL